VPLPDEALVARVLDLHRKLEAGVLSRKGLELTDKLFGVARSRSTVSLVEARTTRGTVEIINTTSTTYYKMISENPEKWLLPGEQLGSRPTQVYGPKEVGERPPRQAIHAEELGVNDARALGARSGRVASSNLGCDEQCVSLLREEFPGFRHLNPERPGTQPPPVPEAVADAAARRGVSVGSRAVPDLTSPAASRATGAERRLRGLVALGAASWTIGQVCWNIQTGLGFSSIPAPSDLGYLGASLPIVAALMLAVHGRLPRVEEVAVHLDSMAVFLAIRHSFPATTRVSAIATRPCSTVIPRQKVMS